MTNNDGSFSRNESYVLYCDQQQPGNLALLDAGIVVDSPKYFSVPLTKVMVDDTFTSTYIEVKYGAFSSNCAVVQTNSYHRNISSS